MAKRGRPTKNGAKPVWMLGRAVIALNGYDDERRKGEKYSVAIKAGVSAVRSWYPKMRISETEVKRRLAQWRRKGCEETMLIKKEIVEGPQADIYYQRYAELAKDSPKKVNAFDFDDDTPKRVTKWVVGFGRAPHYPRHNAKNFTK